MTSKVTREVKTAPGHRDFLDSMAKKYDIADSSKAFRCCINYAAQTSLSLDSKAFPEPTESVKATLSATEGQWRYMDETGTTVAQLLNHCISECEKGGEEAQACIFQVVRCKTRTNGADPVAVVVADESTPCAGAQAALAKAQAAPPACGCGQ